MTTDAAEDDLQFRRRTRRTRWIAALLEGGAATIPIGLLSGHWHWAGIAFGTVALVAFLLWPMTIKDKDFSLWRLVAFGAAVVFLGTFLWFLIFLIPTYSHQPHVSFLGMFVQILEWSVVTVWILGIFAIPVAIGIARLAVILGNPRIEPR
jgi:hypothetical protein